MNFAARCCDYAEGANRTLRTASEHAMATVIRFPIERRDFGASSPLAAGESAVIIPFPVRGSREIAAQVVPAKAGTQ
jgi:hypothetical protein